MTKVNLTLENFQGNITVEDKNYILTETRINKFIDPKTSKPGTNYGQPQDFEIGFFKNMAMALEKVIQLEFANREEEYTLMEFMQEFRQVREMLESQLS